MANYNYFVVKLTGFQICVARQPICKDLENNVLQTPEHNSITWQGLPSIENSIQKIIGDDIA